MPFAKGNKIGKGRPPAGKGLTEALRMALNRKNPFDAQGRNFRESFVEKTLTLAMAGNPAALKEVWDRIDGKVQAEDWNSREPIQIQIVHLGGEFKVQVPPKQLSESIELELVEQ